MPNVYTEKIHCDALRLYNGSGSDIDQDEFTVLGGFAAIAQEDCANASYGFFEVEEGIQVQSSDLVTGEDTFATLGQPVFYDPVGDEFSDTANSDYYEVGRLTQAKDANGVIVFDKYRYALTVQPDET